MSNDRSPQTRQRGFTLIVVFLLVILMVGVAATVLMSSQTDLQIAGQDRESTVAFYAAEAGIAFAKDWLSARAPVPGPAAWNAILNSGVPQLCAPNPNVFQAGVNPQTARTNYDNSGNGQITFNFCIHNNPLDPAWASGNGSRADQDGIITIESYGYGPTGTSAHVIVEVQASGVMIPPQGGYIFGGDGKGKGEAGVSTGNQIGGA